MAEDKIQMPSSGAGLTRFFDDYKSKIEIKPEHVIVMIVVIILVEILLNWQGNVWFGLA
jgi:preprotein translocase subunit Sec61beta